MKVVVVEEPGRVGLRDVPEPCMGEYDALVRVVAGSLCNGTDRKILQGTFAGPLPTVLGHEAVGVVIETGCRVRNYAVGDLVVRPTIGYEMRDGLSSSFGAFAERGLVTDAWARAEDEGGERPGGHPQMRHEPGWDPRDLVVSITLKETLSTLRNLGVLAGQSIMIVGTGPVGVAFSLWARREGCDPVILVGRRDGSIERAMGYGGATHAVNNARQNVAEVVHRIAGGGVDVAVEAVGDDGALRDCVACLTPTGRVGVYGIPPAGAVRSAAWSDPRVCQGMPREAMVHDEVLGAMQAGVVPGRSLLTHEVDWRECDCGFRLLETGEAFKVGLRFCP